MKVYTGPVSLFSSKVRIALDEKALPREEVRVGWSLAARYRPHHPEVLARNPKGQVPVLVDGDLTVYDSTQILEYLEDRYPTPPLYPADVAGRARCRRLEAWGDEILFPPVFDLVEEVFYPAGSGARDPGRLERARAKIAELHAELDREIGDREYLSGAFSAADIAVFVMVATGAALGAAPDPGLRNLSAWLARTGARPAVRREMEGMQTFVASLRQGAAPAPHVSAAATTAAALV